jgi:hypothetical protein
MKKAILIPAAFLAALLAMPVACVPPPMPPAGTGHLNVTPRGSVPVDDATAKEFMPLDDMAVIYIYRPLGFVASGLIRGIVCDGTFIGLLPNGSYTRMALPEGEYQFTITEAGADGSIDEIAVKAGRVYFFTTVVQIRSMGLLVGNATYQLSRVPPEEAKIAILGRPMANGIEDGLKLVDNPYNR